MNPPYVCEECGQATWVRRYMTTTYVAACDAPGCRYLCAYWEGCEWHEHMCYSEVNVGTCRTCGENPACRVTDYCADCGIVCDTCGDETDVPA